mgnify:CR=1 FL=1
MCYTTDQPMQAAAPPMAWSAVSPGTAVRKEKHMAVWLAGLVLFGVIEAATAGLTVIWFAVGSLAALAVTALGAPLWLQMVVFLTVSLAALAITRPLVQRYVNNKKVPTNADRCLGQTARVTEAIDNSRAKGAVYIDGKTWSARSEGEGLIPVGTPVTVLRMEGVKLIVTPRETDAETE